MEEDVPSALGRCHARQDGFDLHAGVLVPAGQRERLERLCRYALRPAVAQDRLSVTADSQVRLELKHPWSDGTTHLLFDPVELLERLAVITPRPRINLILYYGVLAPRAAWRSQVVEHAPSPDVSGPASTEAATPEGAQPIAGRQRPGALRWAELMRRTFGFDVLACPRCGGRLRLIALIEHASVIQRILRHLGLPTEIPRAPPRSCAAAPLAVRIRHVDDDATTFEPC